MAGKTDWLAESCRACAPRWPADCRPGFRVFRLFFIRTGLEFIIIEEKGGEEEGEGGGEKERGEEGGELAIPSFVCGRNVLFWSFLALFWPCAGKIPRSGKTRALVLPRSMGDQGKSPPASLE